MKRKKTLKNKSPSIWAVSAKTRLMYRLKTDLKKDVLNRQILSWSPFVVS